MSMKHQMLGAVLLSMLAAACSPQSSIIQADLLIENVHVVPMNEEVVVADQAVAISNGEIVAIIDQASAHRVDAAERIDGAGRYMLPGLSDMHIHMRMEPQAVFNLFLANGVTTVSNMGLADGRGRIDHLQLRADVAAGRMTGPRYRVSGPQLNSSVLSELSDVAPMLDRHVEQAYDVVKVHGDLDPDIYDALITGAHERGLLVTGHSQHLRPLEHTLRMDSIEHAEEFVYVSRTAEFGQAAAGSLDSFLAAYYPHAERMADPSYRAATIQDVAASGIYLDPTLIIYSMVGAWLDDGEFAAMSDDPHLRYLPEETIQRWTGPDNPYRVEGFHLTTEHVDTVFQTLSATVFDLHQAGVPLLLGSDSFGNLVPGFSVHKELQLMVDAGLTPYEALRTGTVNAAAYLGELESAGTIETGKRADFIFVDGNPLSNIANAGRVRGVYTAGNWYSHTDLNARLEEASALVR